MITELKREKYYGDFSKCYALCCDLSKNNYHILLLMISEDEKAQECPGSPNLKVRRYYEDNGKSIPDWQKLQI